MAARYNVVTIGKSGVGKSTFINYLYGKNVMKTGTGKPVTQGFKGIDFTINDLPVTLFDSQGLEAGKSDAWKKSLEDELNKRGTNTSAEQWYHTVLYCVSAGGARIEDFELNIINKFIRDKYKVTVILTKADQSSQEELDELQTTLKNNIENQVPVIPACSEEKILLGGGSTKRFGKEEIEVQAYKDFWDSIAMRLPERCVYVLNDEIDKWSNQQKKYIDENIGYFNDMDIRSKLTIETKLLVENLDSIVIGEIKNTLGMYKLFSEYLRYPHVSLINFTPISFSKDNDLHGWEHLFLIPCVIALPFLIPFNKKWEKSAITKHLENIVQNLKTEVPKAKSKIKKLINSLKTSK